jgi:hypothetical protein
MIPNQTTHKFEKIIDIISDHLDQHQNCNCVTEILEQFYNKNVQGSSTPSTKGHGGSQNQHDNKEILTNG